MAKIYLHGIIGKDVTALDIIRGIDSANQSGEREITIDINSNGGSVDHANSIIDAMDNSRIPIYTHVSGCAKSAGAIILMKGKKVTASPDAYVMIHNASLPFGGNADELEKDIVTLRDMDSKMAAKISAKSGLPINEVVAMMKAETTLSARAAKEKGFIDEITGSPLAIADKSPEAVYDFINKKDKTNDMIYDKATKEALGLQETATDAEVLEAIKKNRENAEANANALETERKKGVKEKATTLVDAAVKDGKIAAAVKEDFIAQAEGDYDRTKRILDAMPAASGKSIMEQIREANAKTAMEGKDAWTFDDFQKKEPEALVIMEAQDKPRFDRLLQAHTAKSRKYNAANRNDVSGEAVEVYKRSAF